MKLTIYFLLILKGGHLQSFPVAHLIQVCILYFNSIEDIKDNLCPSDCCSDCSNFRECYQTTEVCEQDISFKWTHRV